MAIKDLFNKAAKGVKTLFKKDGLIQSTFNKGSAIFDKGSSFIDKGIGTALKYGAQIGDTARNLAPALTAINPELGLAAMAVGNAVNKGSKYLSGIANKKNEVVNKINDVRSKIMIPKQMLEMPEENINFA